MALYSEEQACAPMVVEASSLNSDYVLPYGLEVGYIYRAMADFTNWLDIINQQMFINKLPRLESFDSMGIQGVDIELVKSASRKAKVNVSRTQDSIGYTRSRNSGNRNNG